MRYLEKSFSSRPATKEYAEGWERTFGKKITHYVFGFCPDRGEGDMFSGLLAEVTCPECGGDPE